VGFRDGCVLEPGQEPPPVAPPDSRAEEDQPSQPTTDLERRRIDGGIDVPSGELLSGVARGVAASERAAVEHSPVGGVTPGPAVEAGVLAPDRAGAALAAEHDESVESARRRACGRSMPGASSASASAGTSGPA
tara:strand:+ start:615 stop:1016 length:402 start_codon:yes stop_codon:yes gene_type:complete